MALIAGLLWTVGGDAAPTVRDAADAAALGLLVSAPVSLATYGTLFRGADDPFLRRLGVHQRAVYAERASRLLALALSVAVVPVLMTAGADRTLGVIAAVSVGSAMAAWSAGVAALTLAARAMALRSPGQGWGCLTAGLWDRELAAAAPMMYAPLLPLLAGGAAGAFMGAAEGAPIARIVPLALASVALVARVARAWEVAAPRFSPRVIEMSIAPPPSGTHTSLRVGRGLARLLPRPAAAVWARDVVVAGRRMSWATRIVWPVALIACVALARWGEDPETRRWVVGAAAVVWLLQAFAMLQLGRLERDGFRWLDRALGITSFHRVLGRWAWGWGMTLWLGVPVGLAWGWWTDAGPAWPWLGVGALTAGVGAVGSSVAAGWR